MAGILQRGIASQYDRSARRYDRAARFNLLAAERLAAAIPGADHRAVLDVGCGTGFATLAVLGRFPVERLTAVDVSPRMVDMLAAKLAAREGLDADLIVSDVAAMDVPAGAFDLAVCCMALHWFTDRPGAIARMAAALRPGGVLALVAPGPGHDREYQEILRGIRPPVLPAMVDVFTVAQVFPGATADQARAAGLEVLDVWVEERRRTVPPEEYMERITAVGSHVWGHLPQDEEDALLARVRRGVSEASGPDGFRYTFTKTFLVARRPF